MDSNVAVLAVSMRWLHIVSVVTLIGGFIFARFALAPALTTLPDTERKTLDGRVVACFRPLLYAAMLAVLVSGLYNYLSKATYAPRYHMIIGIKLLFVLHIFAVSILYSLPGANPAKRNRWLTGMIFSGLIAIALAGYARWISLP
jgi:uncharacterized membrane protein